LAVLDFLSIGKASFFGFSNGATTRLKFVTMYPYKFEKLIAASGNTKREGLQRIPHARLLILPANHGNYMMTDFNGGVNDH